MEQKQEVTGSTEEPLEDLRLLTGVWPFMLPSDLCRRQIPEVRAAVAKVRGQNPTQKGSFKRIVN